ncbi:hypothetical protein FH966_11805 [Lentibacillus cibarius]|uniref:Uncharacterized protein n=1 Tax=Lentibacillus cibarius TaxID=2583219 RepID=A0A549YKA6_9BACI|nr:hypothetical protein [Lentibacillus cibarius]TRM12315.1 hypothetical protein FH966_11805 [Lentibacillus cibarius]
MVAITANILGWLGVAIIFYSTYRKQNRKPVLWKVILVFIIGMVSFSFNWNFRGVKIGLPVLPLGVWILLLVFRVKGYSWQTYRSFAWLGFISMFIFVVTTLLTIPVQQALFPKDELSTYMTNVEKASIIKTHPSAEEHVLDKEGLAKQIGNMEPKPIHSEQWYGNIVRDNHSVYTEEKFPYQLTGERPKWGSGAMAIIYVEKDGKGLLVTTPKSQYYYRSDDSLFKEGTHR